jgi:hypothetical protein
MLMRLQHAAGNHAIAGILQRQVVEEDPDIEILDEPLDATATAAAIRYYRSQPDRYPPDVMAQVQRAVGAEETGVPDEQTVQAVARWQRDVGSNDPVLKIDGKAGPRTLPRLFPHGLNEPGRGEQFGSEAQEGVIDRWGEMTPRQRATELVRLVNVHLEAAKVPPVGLAPEENGNNAGSFSFRTWTMNVGLQALAGDQLTRDEAAEIVDTIYHEARHAEQWFRMAQLRAGQGRTAAQIASELEIEIRIARLACAAPLARGSMQALIAQGWYDSVYGPGAAHRDRTLTELDASATARTRARERFEKNPTPANQAALDAAIARADRAHDAYRELPEENDAWATGPMVQPGVTRGTPEPEAEEELVPAGGAAPPPTGGATPPPVRVDALESALASFVNRGRKSHT